MCRPSMLICEPQHLGLSYVSWGTERRTVCVVRYGYRYERGPSKKLLGWTPPIQPSRRCRHRRSRMSRRRLPRSSKKRHRRQNVLRFALRKIVAGSVSASDCALPSHRSPPPFLPLSSAPRVRVFSRVSHVCGSHQTLVWLSSCLVVASPVRPLYDRRGRVSAGWREAEGRRRGHEPGGGLCGVRNPVPGHRG